MAALAPFAWPLATLIFGVIVLFVFREPLTAFFWKLNKVSMAGASLTAAKDPQGQLAPPPPSLPPQYPANPALEKVKTEVRSRLRLSEYPQDLREDLLLSATAGAVLTWEFEVIYRIIFGSQITALEFLNSGPQQREALRSFYSVAAAHNPAFFEHFDFDHWLAFLETRQLVMAGPGPGLISISEYGRMFLGHLVQQGLPLLRPN
jgi:hypothetical protein